MATQLCPRCGAEVNENTEYCKTCGTPISPPEPKAKPETAEPKAEDVKVEAAQPQAEPIESVKVEPTEEVKVNPVEEVKAEPADEVKAEAAEPQTEPVEEVKTETVEPETAEPAEGIKAETTEESAEPVKSEPVMPDAVNGVGTDWPVKSKIIAGILGIFLGGFGLHHFYLGNTKQGGIFLAITLVGFVLTFIGIGAIVVGVMEIIGFVQGIMILFMSKENFEQKYHCRAA